MFSFNVPNTLKKGVGRKILGLFLLAGVLPVIFTAVSAYYEIARATQADVEQELRASAKSYGVDILTRLELAAEKATEIDRLFEEQGSSAIVDNEYLLEDFTAIWQTQGEGLETVVIAGAAHQVEDVEFDEEFIATGASQLLIASGNTNHLHLVRAVEPQGDGPQYMVFMLDAANIWGPRENIPFNTDFCVSGGGSTLYCTNPNAIPPGASAVGSLRTGDHLLYWEVGEYEYVGSAWQLFLVSSFRAPSLDIIASQPRDFALRSKADFRRVFVPALILVILLVGTISFSAIGRTLVPLQYLTAATKQIAGGNLEARVRVRTGDEIETLADAFNNMASRLEEQIETLEAMSGIDRLILTGAPFEAVAESVIKQLVKINHCDVAAVIAHDDPSGSQGRMISACRGAITHDVIALPQDPGGDWYQPRQVSLDEIDDDLAPYKSQFLAYGQKFAVIIPVVMHEDLKGILLLGSTTKMNMSQGGVQRSIDMAGRFAVALSSAEREDALYRQAHYDELTGLPNRQLVKDRLGDLIDQAKLDERSGALLYLDLDRFKEINDVYGHSVGDIVLTQAAERIVNEVRENDLVSRLGGDEFVVVLPKATDNERVKAMAVRLLSRLTEVFSVFGVNHFVGVSIGIAMFPDDGDSVETLLKNADAAMYRAKDAGRARYEFFNMELNDESRRKIELERDLRTAFAERQLEVFYQPQFELSSGVICGAEALLRWNHTELGYISPSEFVPLAEESQLIVDIGRWVIDQSCGDLRQILDKGLHPGPVSINVSARQLRDRDFPKQVRESLHKHSIHPGFLQLEVTETTVAQNRDTAIEILSSLREHGVRIAIDDFGTGYSSLSYLQNMPFDVIKIDKSFVDLIGAGLPSDNICRTIIRMAHELGKSSIAEGVETRKQAEFLREYDCDTVQGYLYAKALQLQEFIAFIRKQDFHTQRRKALEII